MRGKLNKKVLLLKAITSAAFFIILVSFIQGNELASVALRIDWFYFSLSLLLAPLMLFISCLKWKILLDTSGTRIGFFTLVRIYFIGYFFSNLLPSTVGGDVVRSYYAGKIIENQAYAAVSVFIERFTGILFLLLLVIVAPLLHHGLYQSPFVYIPAIGAFFLFLLVLWIWKVKNPLMLPDRFMQLVFSKLSQIADRLDSVMLSRGIVFIGRTYDGLMGRLSKFKNELSNAYSSTRQDRQFFVVIILLTILFYFLTWVNVYIAFRAFGIHPSFWAVSALVPTILFVAQIPVTVLGNLGFFESVFVFYFLLIQIPVAESLMMGLLLRVKMLMLGLIGLLIYLSYKRGKSGEFTDLRTHQHEIP